MSILDKAKDIATGVKESVQSKAKDTGLIDEKDISKMEEATSIGAEKIKSILKELSDSREIFREAGYEEDGISVAMGLPPKVTVSLIYSEDVPEEKEKELLERTKDRKLIQVLLKTLFKAASMESEANKLNYKMVSVNVQLGLIPSVVLNFAQK
ncbi:MAG: hypothetical protein J7604_18230 [Sporocytophaga sp.]|uniref:hypothetical protein n=1 Tax=Sporocytophaga sp. TaxID=2231183 RepID=UPI001B043322|nr:hypothetical protein [Sporocytophaga sp.]MBO9702153.1 hypothetical protein [Sporocytophaga sp.]